jgi:tetratricopeptide (TPR) repeat protein
VAKNSNGFFSKLAPEDRRFIRKIGVFFFLLLLISGGGLYAFTYFEKQGKVPPAISELVKTHLGSLIDISSYFSESKDSLANSEFPDISSDIPAIPDIPDIPDFSDTSSISDLSDFELPPSLVTPTETEERVEQVTDAYIDSRSTEPPAQASMSGISKMFLEKPKLAARLGHLLLDAGYPDEAVYILQNGVSRDSAPIPVLVDLAYGHFYSKKFETALSDLDTALNKYPSNADLLTAKAAITGQHPDTTQRNNADAMFKAILKKNPESAETNYQYGRYIMQRGDFKKSQEYLEKAVKFEPYNSRYIARLGMVEFYLKHDANAEILYKRALKINPDDYNTWFNLGELYLSGANESRFIPEIRKKTHLALESYLKTIEHDSLHASANYRIGLILNGNGGYREAIKHLSIALKKTPSDISAMQQLSSAYMLLGDTARSIYYLEEILRIDPFNKVAANEYGRIKRTGKNVAIEN